MYTIEDQIANVIAIGQRSAQYDNGVAAGAPPTFEPMPEPELPRESGTTASFLPRLGGDPILLDAGTTVNAPKGADTAQAAKVAPSPLPAAAAPILRDASEESGAGAAPTRAVDWRLVVAASLAALLFFFILRDDDS